MSGIAYKQRIMSIEYRPKPWLAIDIRDCQLAGIVVSVDLPSNWSKQQQWQARFNLKGVELTTNPTPGKISYVQV